MFYDQSQVSFRFQFNKPFFSTRNNFSLLVSRRKFKTQELLPKIKKKNVEKIILFLDENFLSLPSMFHIVDTSSDFSCTAKFRIFILNWNSSRLNCLNFGIGSTLPFRSTISFGYFVRWDLNDISNDKWSYYRFDQIFQHITRNQRKMNFQMIN